MGMTARLRAVGANTAAALTLVALALPLTGCAGAARESGPAAVAAPFSAGGVAVSVRVEPRDDGLRVLAELRPERAGFHVYSLALPDGGVDGIGIPTRIRAEGALRPTGPATTDAQQRVLRPEGLGVRLPVYQDGRVTLELPVRRVEDTGRDRAWVFLTYGACSEREGCLLPVRDRAVTLELRPA
ncbi:hypothetical protein ACWELO_05110 [Streptomyces sp. NPDC004596]|uniref:hypothetical protein n=1 Tax=Streptomyces sp. DSM 118148 TaxID=3448667 RepID=UPI00403FF172